MARVMTAEAVAYRLQVSESWVYEHKDELGAFKICDGRKGWRFREDAVERYLQRRMGPVEEMKSETAKPFVPVKFQLRRAG